MLKRFPCSSSRMYGPDIILQPKGCEGQHCLLTHRVLLTYMLPPPTDQPTNQLTNPSAHQTTRPTAQSSPSTHQPASPPTFHPTNHPPTTHTSRQADLPTFLHALILDLLLRHVFAVFFSACICSLYKLQRPLCRSAAERRRPTVFWGVCATAMRDMRHGRSPIGKAPMAILLRRCGRGGSSPGASGRGGGIPERRSVVSISNRMVQSLGPQTPGRGNPLRCFLALCEPSGVASQA